VTRALVGVVLVAAGPSVYAETVRREVLMQGTRYQTGEWIKTGEQPGPVVMVIGGVHGDEPGGYMAADRLVKWRITKGTLAVIPEAHKEAIRRKVRGYPGNMNRMLPGDPHGDDMHRLAYAIWSQIKAVHPGLLVTLHESRGFHAEDSSAFGQTLTHDFAVINPLMQRAIARANPDIGPERDHFRIYIYPVETCPTYVAWERLRIPATSIETAKPLPLEQRIEYQLMMLMGFFDEVGLGYQPIGLPRLSTTTRPPGTDLDTYAAQVTGEKRVPKTSGRQAGPSPESAPRAAPVPSGLAQAGEPARSHRPWLALCGGALVGVLVAAAFICLFGRRLRRRSRA